MRPPYHIIKLTPTGWTIQHPLSDGDDLFDCPLTKAADLMEQPRNYGKFRADLSEDGELVIGEPQP